MKMAKYFALIYCVLLLAVPAAIADFIRGHGGGAGITWSETAYRVATPISNLLNEHYFAGGPKIIREGDVVWATTRNASFDTLYRSVDGGQTWTKIYEASSTIAGGKTALLRNGGTTAWWIYNSSDIIYVRTFVITDTTVTSSTFNATYPAFQAINEADISETNTGNYKTLCATIDSDGDLYVFFVHETTSGTVRSDDIWVIHSDDAGATWDAAVAISGSLPDSTWFLPTASVTPANVVVVAFHAWGGTNIRLATCSDGNGAAWTVRTVTTTGLTYNAAPLPLGGQELYLFAQTHEETITGCGDGGLVANHSDDLGVTWDGWELIDCTCDYADPAAARGSDGTVYVAYRDFDPNSPAGSCGDRSRATLAYKPMAGGWVTAVDWLSTDTNPFTGAGYERTATHAQLRYQPFFNGGGPLDMMWIQYEAGGTNFPAYFTTNSQITIGYTP